MDLSILGKAIPVQRAADVSSQDWTIITDRLNGFPGEVNSALHVTAQQRSTMLLLDGIVIFRSIGFKGRKLTRSFVDLENRLFHWHAGELLKDGYGDSRRVATYYFHDAFHVAQYIAGDRATDLDSLVRREVEGTAAQLDLAIALRADQPFLDFLRNYMTNRQEIEDRLKTGVGILGALLFGKLRFADHLPIIE